MRHGQKIAVRLSFGCVFIAVPQMALAGDDIRARAEVTTSGGYSNNPFSTSGSDLGSAYVQINAKPEIKLIAERNVFLLSGLLNYQHYFHGYSDTKDFGAGLDYSGVPNSQLTTHASVKYDSSIIGSFEAINGIANPTQPPPKTGPDLALFGTKQRRRSLDFVSDGAFALAAHDSLTANAYYSVLRYGAGANNYDAYGGGVGYARSVSAHLHLGVQMSGSRYAYQGLLGKIQVYSLQATVTDQISSYWNLTGALGVSHSARSSGSKSMSPTGNLQLCRVSERSSLCATVSGAVLPNGSTGVTTTTMAGGRYSYVLSEHSNIALSGSYSHSGNLTSAIVGHTVQSGNRSFSTTASYDRTLRQRIHLTATTRYRKIMGGTINRSDDFGGSLGVSIKFGEYR